MPLYEYRCEACGRPEEKLQSFSAPEAHDCEGCGASLGMKRQVSVSGFSLAGGGWYKGAATESGGSSAASKPSHGCGAGGCGCPMAG